MSCHRDRLFLFQMLCGNISEDCIIRPTLGKSSPTKSASLYGRTNGRTNERTKVFHINTKLMPKISHTCPPVQSQSWRHEPPRHLLLEHFWWLYNWTLLYHFIYIWWLYNWTLLYHFIYNHVNTKKAKNPTYLGMGSRTLPVIIALFIRRSSKTTRVKWTFLQH